MVTGSPTTSEPVGGTYKSPGWRTGCVTWAKIWCSSHVLYCWCWMCYTGLNKYCEVHMSSVVGVGCVAWGWIWYSSHVLTDVLHGVGLDTV